MNYYVDLMTYNRGSYRDMFMITLACGDRNINVILSDCDIVAAYADEAIYAYMVSEKDNKGEGYSLKRFKSSVEKNGYDNYDAAVKINSFFVEVCTPVLHGYGLGLIWEDILSWVEKHILPDNELHVPDMCIDLKSVARYLNYNETTRLIDSMQIDISAPPVSRLKWLAVFHYEMMTYWAGEKIWVVGHRTDAQLKTLHANDVDELSDESPEFLQGEKFNKVYLKIYIENIRDAGYLRDFLADIIQCFER